MMRHSTMLAGPDLPRAAVALTFHNKVARSDVLWRQQLPAHLCDIIRVRVVKAPTLLAAARVPEQHLAWGSRHQQVPAQRQAVQRLDLLCAEPAQGTRALPLLSQSVRKLLALASSHSYRS